jgi:hypothetical protein
MFRFVLLYVERHNMPLKKIEAQKMFHFVLLYVERHKMPLKIEAQKIIPSCIDVCFKTIMSPADALRLVRNHVSVPYPHYSYSITAENRIKCVIQGL